MIKIRFTWPLLLTLLLALLLYLVREPGTRTAAPQPVSSRRPRKSTRATRRSFVVDAARDSVEMDREAMTAGQRAAQESAETNPYTSAGDRLRSRRFTRDHAHR